MAFLVGLVSAGAAFGLLGWGCLKESARRVDRILADEVGTRRGDQ